MINPIVLSALVGIASTAPLRRDQQCNGSPDLCNTSYSNISQIGTHDSAFVGNLNDPRINQILTVTQQLDAGIRFLQAQTHMMFGELSMCHTSCLLLYAGSLSSYLTEVKDWMDASGNENEVVTILLTNGDNEPIDEFGNVVEKVGLDDYAYVPSTSPFPQAKSDWPTLSSMISSGKRLVLFLDYGADESTFPVILDEFSYFFETPFDVTDPTFSSCEVNRPPNSSPDGKMYIVNHFLDEELLGSDSLLIPDNDADMQTNAATGPGSIGAQVNLCEGLYERKPNVVLLDMFNRGQWQVAQNSLEHRPV